jgi:hypothetical protein
MADKRSRKRKPYSLKDVQLIGSHALQELERILLSSSDDDQIIKAANSIGSLMNAYKHLMETTDIVSRLEALEQQQKQHLKRVI